MAEEERTVKKIKVQVGSNLSSVSVSFSSQATSSDPANQVPDFATTSNVTLAELCDSSYLLRQRKSKIPSTGNIFPESVLSGKSKPSSSTPKEIQPQKMKMPTTPDQPVGPRVEIIDGKIVLKESSLMINGPDGNLNEGEYEEVEEGIHVSSRYSSFTNRRNPRIWGIEETRVFYTALRQCGLDFSMMQTFFPNRTRKELKMKFFREEKSHPDLVKAAMNSSLPLDLTPFEIQLGSDLKEDIVKKALKKEESVDTSADLLLLQSNDKTEKDEIENKDNTSHSVVDTREAVAAVSVTN